MHNIFYTADLHFNHANVIKYCNRPFVSVEEMNEILIDNWNSKVKSQDIVYFLGDFAFANHETTEKYLKRLNGNIHLCRGNHDKSLNGLHKYFTSVFDLKTILFDDESAPNGRQPVVMSHYPLLSFDRQRYGSWMLHGHCHGTIKFDPKIRRIDVGVDNWDYYPVSYEEIKQYLNKNFVG